MCCLESKGLRLFKEDPMLETMGTTGLYLLNHSRRAHLYQSNHVKKDPSEEDKQEGMDADNVLEETEVVRDTWLLPCWSSCWERPVHAGSSPLPLTGKWPTGPALVSAKPPCLTGIPASLPQFLLKGAGIRVDSKYSVSCSLLNFCHKSFLSIL